MKKIIVLVFFLFTTLTYASLISIDKNSKNIDILSKSEIFIDKSRELSINEVKNKKFTANNKKNLAFGYSPDFNVWIKFTLYNNSEEAITKILEYDNPLATHIYFYNEKNGYKEEKGGLFSKEKERVSTNQIFNIELNPKEKNIYYIRASSYITTLIIKLKLWDIETFFDKEVKHQIILSLFFGAMLILGIYNLFIFFFTKDISYLYYVLYIFGILFHQLVYVGFARLYIFDTENMIRVIEGASIIVAAPVLALGLFTKNFLKTKQYKIHNIILDIFLTLIPASILFFLVTESFDKYRNVITMLFLIYLMYITLYAALKKNKQAYFILFAWTIFLTTGMLMFLSSAGIFDIFEHIPYLIEISFVSEALVFSVALANRINSLQEEKEIANQKLLIQQQNETQRLAKKVDERTKDLTKTLEEKSLLLKELNHRVKNNMQTIVSLIRLQNDEMQDDKLQDVLITIQNRINSMSHLHELLYRDEDISHINAYEYFEILIEEVKYSYERDIDIHLNIKTNLKIEQAIYCGLILNELITNSFKYAFPDEIGNIYINLEKRGKNYILEVKDDGVGYTQSNRATHSLGLTLVRTLAVEQLEGKISIDSKNGVDVVIKWKDHDKS
jgi:two-component sensor histidine kinase